MTFTFECVGYKSFTSKKGSRCTIAYFAREMECNDHQSGAGLESVSCFVKATPVVGKEYSLFLVNQQWFANIE